MKLENYHYSASEAARFDQVCRQSIIDRIRDGHYPNAYVIPGGVTYKIPHSDLIAYRNGYRANRRHKETKTA